MYAEYRKKYLESKKDDKEFQEKQKNIKRYSWYKIKYGMERSQVDDFLKVKNCPICGSSGKIVVDHDHDTKKIRGYICHQCNTAIGYARENIGFLINMIEYIKSFDD